MDATPPRNDAADLTPKSVQSAAPAAGSPPVTPESPMPSAKPPERRRRLPGWHSGDVIRATALVGALFVAAKLLWFAHQLLLVAFLGILFGLAVTAGVDRLHRFRIPRGIGAALIVLGTLGLLSGFIAILAPTLRDQSKEMRARLPEALDKFDTWLEKRQTGFLGLFFGAGDSTSIAAPPAVAPEARTRDSTTVDSAARAVATQRRDSITQGTVPGPADEVGTAGSRLRAQIFSQLSGAKRYFFPFLTSTLTVLGGIVLIIFLAIYVAAEPDLYHDGLMGLFPHSARNRAGEVLSAMATALRRWLVTQLIAMLAIGGVTTIVLLVLDVKAAISLGILAGLLEFIPTIGPLLSALPAILMAFVDSPQKALYVTIAYFAIQFLENHILIPILMKEGVNLPPALTVMAQALMALIFGFLGLLVAVPLLAAIVVAVKLLYVEDVVGDEVEVLGDGG